MSIFRAGYLEKRGKFVTAWRRRWFELIRDEEGNGKLEYFLKEGGRKKGVIVLDSYLVCRCLECEGMEARKELVFCLVTEKGRTWHFRAEREDDVVLWKKDFAIIIRSSQKKTRKKTSMWEKYEESSSDSETEIVPKKEPKERRLLNHIRYTEDTVQHLLRWETHASELEEDSIKDAWMRLQLHLPSHRKELDLLLVGEVRRVRLLAHVKDRIKKIEDVVNRKVDGEKK